VVDYLTMPSLDAVSSLLSGRDFPIFNLSDVLVSTGTVWLLWASWRAERKGSLKPSRLTDITEEKL